MHKRIVFTRHPECLHNVEQQNAILAGIPNRNSPLTKVGEVQRDITAEYLVREFQSFDAVFCSTYYRARTIPIAAGFESELIVNPLLDERNMGVWHKHLRADVLAKYPGEEDKLKAAGYYAYEPPEGESCASVENRLNEFLNSEIFCGRDFTIYISGHGITGLCLRRLLTNASVDDWNSWDRLKNASVTVYEYSGTQYECTRYNYVPWEGLIDRGLLRKGTEA